MASEAFLLPLTTLVSKDDLPALLADLIPQNLFDAVFGSIFYRDLQVRESADGTTTFYSMTLTVCEDVSLDFGGGFKLLINPGQLANAQGERVLRIPFSLSYQWKLLRLLNSFDLGSFSFDADGFNDILHRLLGVTMNDLLTEAVQLFVGGATPEAAFNTFVADVNTQYALSPAITLTGQYPAKIAEFVVKAELHPTLRANGVDIPRIVYDVLLTRFGSAMDAVERLYTRWAGGSPLALAKNMLVPKITATARFAAGLSISRDWLIPMKPPPYDTEEEGDQNKLSVITFGEADVMFSTEGGFGIETQFSASLPLSRIAGTDFYIAFQNARLDLSRTTNIPEVSNDGRPPEFVGAFVETLDIRMRGRWSSESGQNNTPTDTAKLVGKNMIIGTGGVSGTITLAALGAAAPQLFVKLFGFSLELNDVSITLSKNRITHCAIHGKLRIPRASESMSETIVDVLIGFKNGDFEITAKVAPPISFSIENLFELKIATLAVGSDAGRYFLAVGGTLDITANIPPIGRLLDQSVEIRRLVIWSNGEVDFEGGGIVLPKSISLTMGPVKLSVSNIHIGSERAMHQGVMRQYKYVGFDGSVNTVVGGVDSRGDGVKLYATVDGLQPKHFYVKVQGIHIHLHIPGDMPKDQAAVLLDGFISVRNGANSQHTQYSGGVKFDLPKLKLKGGAAMALTPATGAYLVDAFLDLSTPILLGSTGLGIYGFRALFGNKYVLRKPEEKTWWEFYKAPPQRGFGVDKFVQTEGFSIGAGVSFATVADSGTAFSAKLGFIFSAPDLFVLTGQAAVISKRVSLDSSDDPPFFAYFALSSKSVEAGIEVHYYLPSGDENNPGSGGDILKLDAAMELKFLFGDANGWHINIGRDTPETKRVSATLLRILNGWSYLMLSSNGIRAGAGISYKFEQDCGIAKVGIGASMEVGGKINFRPAQIGAWLKLMGYAELKVFGIGFRLLVEASLRGEAPHPFIIAGSFRIELDLPWPLPNVGITVGFSWEFDTVRNLHEIGFFEPNPVRQVEGYIAGKHPVKAVHMLTGETFPLNFVAADYAIDQSQNTLLLPPATTHPVSNADRMSDAQAVVGQWVSDFNNFVIPVDCFVDFEFTKAVKPNAGSASMAKFGAIATDAANEELVPPQRGHSPQVKHRYQVDDVKVFYWSQSGGAWQPYEMELANSPLRRILTDKYPALLGNATQLTEETARRLKYGSWQLTESGRYTKLRMLGRTPLGQNPDVPPTELGFPPTVLLCPPPPQPPVCLDWEGLAGGPEYPAAVKLYDRKLHFRTEQPARVVASNGFGKSAALRVNQGDRIEFYFPEPVTKVWLKMATSTEKVTLSYYRGYPWTPTAEDIAAASQGGNRWDAEPVGPATSVGKDSFWEMMRAMPRFVRTLCSGASGPQADVAPIVALNDLMTKTFARTNYYLRQIMGLGTPNPAATFCAKLRETLETVAVATAGKDAPPTALRQNVEYFYLDVKRYAAQYEALRAEAGLAPEAPPTAGNEYYEKWFDVVVCLGRACENRAQLPLYVRTLMAAVVDPEIERLHATVVGQANGFGVHLNALNQQADPLAMMRTIAEFFSIISLNLGTIPASAMDLRDEYGRELYEPARRAAQRLRVVLAGIGSDVCGTAAALRCGGAWRDIIAIPRLLCYDTQTSLPATSAISALLTGFDSTVVALESLFGLDATGAPATLCAALRRALRVVVLALASPNEVDSLTLLRVRTMYTELKRLAGVYEQDVRGQELAGPDAGVESFIADWIDALECLCAMCGSFASLGADEAFFRGRVEALYTAVTSAAFDAGRPLSGAAIETSRCGQVAAIANALTLMQTACATAPTATLTYLNDNIAAFEAALVAFKAGKLAPYTNVVCNGAGLNTDCNRLIHIVGCLQMLLDRKGYLPAAIIEQIVDDFNDTLLSILVSVNPLENVVYQENGILLLPLDTPEDLLPFFVSSILANVNPTCLRGQAFPANISAAVAADMPNLETAFTQLQSSLDGLDASIRVDLCHTPGVTTAARRATMIAHFRALCNVPPTAAELVSAPVADIITLMRDFNATLNEIASIYGLAPMTAGWAAADFCAVFARFVEIIVIAYTDPTRLSLHQETLLLEFYEALAPLVAARGTSNAASGTCQTLCERWLAVFRCLSEACAVAGRIPANVFSDTNDGFEGTFGALLDGAYAKLMALADAAGATARAGQGVDLCRRIRTVINYFSVRALDYANVEASGGLASIFDSFDDLLDAVKGIGPHGTRGRLCPPPVPGPYDPLKKRETKTRAELAQEVLYDNKEEAIDRIAIVPSSTCDAGQTPPCYTYVYEICWLAEAAHVYNDDLPDPEAVRRAANDILVSLKDFPQPIWRPNTTYAIGVKTSEFIDGVAGPISKCYTFGFRTAGPVGHYHEIGAAPVPTYQYDYGKLVAAEQETEFKYATLKHYVDYERSYPNADGNVIGAKPLYFAAAALSLYYRVDYVDTMFATWNAYGTLPEARCGMRVVVADPSRPVTEAIVISEPRWEQDPAPSEPKEFRIFKYMMQNRPNTDCVPLVPLEQLDPQTKPPARRTQVRTDLAPGRLYTAMFTAVFNNEGQTPVERTVHKYVFQTSRYRNLAEHIGSYLLPVQGGGTRPAIYEHVLGNDADVVVARELIDGPAPDTPTHRQLSAAYPLLFDRLVNGALRMGGLPPATTTEFTIVRTSAGGPVIGILVRSPEPFNDPKLPSDELRRGIILSGFGAEAAQRLIMAKDVARIFISTQGGTVAPGNVSIGFQYRLFDGAQYGVATTPVDIGGGVMQDLPVPTETVSLTIV